MNEHRNADLPAPPLIVICGPTGIGKTAAGIEACLHFDGEIVGADSMQIYRHMDIGTAKPTPEERRRVVHHLVDVADPDEDFDAADYRSRAAAAVADIRARGKIPFVVGGTGLYIKALTCGLFEEGRSDASIRDRLWQEAEDIGAEAMHRRLAACDPETAARLHPNDRVRVLRALEIYEQTGSPMSRLHLSHGFASRDYDCLKIALHIDREELYDRIDRRVLRMFDEGLLEETGKLLDMGYDETLKSMQAIGYRHAVNIVRGRWTREEGVRLMQRDTRRYAKRQITWFRADPEIQWIGPEEISSLFPRIRDFLNKTQGPD